MASNSNVVVAPRKRQRTHKKQTQREEGPVTTLVNVPIEIFTEIGLHLLPIDLISLSRSNQLLRSLLMRRSSRHIWQSAMKNMEGLPPCPSNCSEPRYLSLIFSKIYS
ncbi:unnamed protein product, partial [Rhizoctonia solani]